MYRMRPAGQADLDALLAILNGAVKWLQRQDLDQWGGHPWHAEELRPSIDAGTLHLAETTSGIPVATMNLDEQPDKDFWRPADDPGAALYLRHLAVERTRSGHGIGAWMMDQATGHARHARKTWLRLDAWRTNTRLHGYYRQHGFQHVRTVDVPGRGSGALFQRSTTA
ncbi:GNAT family N-acetyltransferase [Micromonospora sp. IBSANI012]|uniref:GNAT family N-acetyltransferase n=1 Tax=Micromonospora sp. IBSANI012 TaxID=3457761 RepID=UPI004057FC72